MTRLGLFLRSTMFSAGMIAATVVFASLGPLTVVFPWRLRYRFMTQWSRFLLWWLKRTCGITYHVRGKEHIPGAAGLVFCKHQSTWETMVLAHIFPPQVWVVKKELLWVPFFGWGLALLRPIAIDRGAGRKAVRQIIEQGSKRLAEGLWVVFFPEGTRVPPGHHRRFRIGGAVLAESTGAPVVPVAHNAGEFWPRRGFLKKPGCVQVVIGAPITVDGLSVNEINQRAEVWMERAMAEISGAPT